MSKKVVQVRKGEVWDGRDIEVVFTEKLSPNSSVGNVERLSMEELLILHNEIIRFFREVE